MYSSEKIKQLKVDFNLPDYLVSKGIGLKRIKSGQYRFFSPFREEKEPSCFVTSYPDNGWHVVDFGTGEKWNSLEFIQKLEGVDFKQAMKLLQESIPSHLAPSTSGALNNKSAYEFITKPLGNNQALKNYVSSRKIDVDLASDYLKEIYYREKGKTKVYFGVGYENDSGGVEVASKYGKYCINQKDITSYTGNRPSLLVFEGLFDMLSYRQFLHMRRMKINSDVVVANSCYMASKVNKFLSKKSYSQIYFYGDADAAGTAFLNELRKCRNDIVDKRNVLEINGCLDLNDLLKKNDKVPSKLIFSREEVVFNGRASSFKIVP